MFIAKAAIKSKESLFYKAAKKVRRSKEDRTFHMPVVSLCTEAGKGSGMNAEKKQKIPYFWGKLSKIAGIFGVPITKALDPRHLFLYNGQGWKIRTPRQSRDQTKEGFAGSRASDQPMGKRQGAAFKKTPGQNNLAANRRRSCRKSAVLADEAYLAK